MYLQLNLAQPIRQTTQSLHLVNNVLTKYQCLAKTGAGPPI